MTDQTIRALIERLKSDKSFRDRLLALNDPEARLELVRAEGFEVTLAEFAAQAALLSDEQLAQAVGAGSADCDTFSCSGYDGCGG
jgi:predicted ribosomally synthesized peptide with nif11-like leader